MGWSKKYKRSIDCSNPKGFSQKAHCDGRKKRKKGGTTKSKTVNEMNKLNELQHIFYNIITEGVDDPGILKCVFMAGGPGSGKSYTAKEIFGVGKDLMQSFSAGGLKIVNSDTAFEKGLKDSGINPKDLGKIEKENPELWKQITMGDASIRGKAKALTKKQQAFYEEGRLGMIIDGTGDDYQKLKKKKDKAEALGYDCYMIFVNTSLEVALKRNRDRDRVLPEDLVREIWHDCQNNLGAFQKLFRTNFSIVDNTKYGPIDSQIQKNVDKFLREPIKNPIGKKWIQDARALKRARIIEQKRMVKSTSSLEERLNLFLEKNVPTQPDKWSYYKSQAKKKFDVYPCVPLDSLAMTKEGLKSYDELVIGEDILTYNMKGDSLQWKPITNLHYFENADLMEIKKATGFRFKCTPNHKWVIKRALDREAELIEAKDITTHMRIVFSSEMNNDEGGLNLLNEQWSKTDTWLEKIIQMTPSEREIWLSSAIVYDGWDSGKSVKAEGRRTFGFSQKNRDHLLSTIYAAYLNGYYVSVNDFERDVVGVSIIREKKTHGTQNLIKTYLEEKEDVWCPETENGTWVMVQNGWFTVTGNSAYANAWAAKKYKAAGGGWRKEK